MLLHIAPQCQIFNQIERNDNHANKIYKNKDGMKQTHLSKLSIFQLTTPHSSTLGLAIQPSHDKKRGRYGLN